MEAFERSLFASREQLEALCAECSREADAGVCLVCDFEDLDAHAHALRLTPKRRRAPALWLDELPPELLAYIVSQYLRAADRSRLAAALATLQP